MPVRAYHAMVSGELWRQADEDFEFVAAFYSQAAALEEARRLMREIGKPSVVEEQGDRGARVIRPRD